MCGITGIVSRRPLDDEARRVLRRVNAAMLHRGPDGAGEYLSPLGVRGEGQVGLAMRRLAIIDVATGDQPLFNETGRLALVANGEIYNYRELRVELEGRGHRFRTGSDCEVILHLYEELGEGCIARLRGMFAFALYDQDRRQVLLARDRMGEKPLYYLEKDDRFYFASEAKALIRAGVIPFRINPDAALRYLYWGFVPGSLSATDSLRRLEPGHYMTVALDSLDTRIVRYWNPRDTKRVEGDPATLLRAKLEDVATMVVRSDVPIGVCLSAGVDSSAVAALAARTSPGAVTGVTVGFSGMPLQDEREGARRFARHLGISHIEVEISPQEAARVLPAVCAASDEPINDSAGCSIYWMMQRCRAEGLKVMLSGLGGDELFWGYGWLRTALQVSERRKHALDGTARWADYLKVNAPPLSYTQFLRWLVDLGGLKPNLASALRDRQLPHQLAFWDLNQSFVDAQTRVPAMFEPTWLAQTDGRDPYRPFNIESWPQNLDRELMCLLFESYLCENGLSQSDRLSSAHSVEMRTPLVDHEFVELVMGLHAQAGPGVLGKATFGDALGDLLPDWVMGRRKRGFSSPWRAWSREFARRHGLLMIDGVLVQEGVLRPDKAAEICVGLGADWLGNHDPFAHAVLRLELWARGFRDFMSDESYQDGLEERVSPRASLAGLV